MENSEIPVRRNSASTRAEQKPSCYQEWRISFDRTSPRFTLRQEQRSAHLGHDACITRKQHTFLSQGLRNNQKLRSDHTRPRKESAHTLRYAHCKHVSLGLQVRSLFSFSAPRERPRRTKDVHFTFSVVWCMAMKCNIWMHRATKREEAYNGKITPSSRNHQIRFRLACDCNCFLQGLVAHFWSEQAKHWCTCNSAKCAMMPPLNSTRCLEWKWFISVHNEYFIYVATKRDVHLLYIVIIQRGCNSDSIPTSLTIHLK